MQLTKEFVIGELAGYLTRRDGLLALCREEPETTGDRIAQMNELRELAVEVSLGEDYMKQIDDLLGELNKIADQYNQQYEIGADAPMGGGMELSEAKVLGRRYLNERGLPFYNFVLYDLPQPCGFRYHNTIGLSVDFVRGHDAYDVAGTVLHEICHAQLSGEVDLQDSQAHEWEFRAEAKRLDAPSGDFQSSNRNFVRLVQFYRDHDVLTRAGQKCLGFVLLELQRWAAAGVKSRDDFETFMVDPYLMKPEKKS